MEKVHVELGERSYEIVIGRGILSGIGERLAAFGFTRTIAVISNPTVFGLYGGQVRDALSTAGFDSFAVLIPDGEGYKDYFWAYHILTELLEKRLDRNSCLVALGGGVIGDITGFAASLYMRGIHFVQVPTTLLAQVDSSVGGKTGVNHLLGKNMIGTFHQPRLVWIDSATLATLPRRELLCGIAEVIKYGVIWDKEFFDFMERQREAVFALQDDALKTIIKRSCEIKAEVVSGDERESGLRAILNYGHTIGHAIETETGYSKYLHGEAIAIGMHLAARLAVLRGLMSNGEAARIKHLIEAYGLPSTVPEGMSPERLIAHMRIDKKAVAGEMKFILPEGIGTVRIEKGVSAEDIRRVLDRA
ncbi:MAG: 3-dehydroquinate synthase [Nitrospirota bacterium]